MKIQYLCCVITFNEWNVLGKKKKMPILSDIFYQDTRNSLWTSLDLYLVIFLLFTQPFIFSSCLMLLLLRQFSMHIIYFFDNSFSYINTFTNNMEPTRVKIQIFNHLLYKHRCKQKWNYILLLNLIRWLSCPMKANLSNDFKLSYLVTP